MRWEEWEGQRGPSVNTGGGPAGELRGGQRWAALGVETGPQDRAG